MALPEDLLARARAWTEQDPDPRTVDELRALLGSPDPAAAAEVADRFAGALEFGTAGLRGVLGAGPNRMNRAVVLRTTWGLARYLKESAPDLARGAGVVVGYDGRRMSRELAEDTAGVLAAEGLKVHLFMDLAPTPLTAFAVKKLGARAGVMVTASHNPPEYNGYKVYWSNGAQIIPPVDKAIAAAIAKAPPANEVPRVTLAGARASGHLEELGPSTGESPAPHRSMERAYLDAIASVETRGRGDRALSIVYTPMHGVGGKLTLLAFKEAGFSNVHVVSQQFAPDGAFPTVAFPNPEEKGAMDLAFALAREKRADLVLANDPDADRLAVAVPHADSPSGYMQLTGNQVGALLGHYLLTEGSFLAAGGASPASPERGPRPGAARARVVIASNVSSPMLGVIAAKLGARYEETLTGFKWIANRAMELEKEGATFVFGFEEALGYTVGDVVRDKDGISAAVVFAELTALLRSRGETAHDQLEKLAREHGLFVSSQVSVTKKGADGAAEIQRLMARLRASPPARVGAHEVTAVSDYDARTRRTSDGKETPLSLPRANVLAFELAGGSRVIARPSGTEPKIKFYFDVREAVRPGEPMTEAETRAAGTAKALTDAFTQLTA